jgi:predicted HTH transcriptional regulator
MANLGEGELLEYLDYPAYFDLTNQQLPTNRSKIIERLKEDGLVRTNKDKLSITNLGAILFAKKLSQFEHLNRKFVRVIIYDGDNKAKDN